jgi:hypothetical protein
MTPPTACFRFGYHHGTPVIPLFKLANSPLFTPFFSPQNFPKMQNQEKSIIEQLKKAKTADATIKNVSAAFAAMRKSDFTATRMLVNGMPYPEWIIVNGRVPLDRLNALKPFWESPLLRDIKLFPYGILNPEGFDVRLRFNTNNPAR